MPLHNWAEFRGRDVIWFIDNEAACSALIRGSSTSEDVQDITEAAAFMSSLLGCRVWCEWVDSFSNVCDGLSRVGLACELAKSLCASLVEVTPALWQGRHVTLRLLARLLSV